jgi:hypothetical protein
MPIGISRELLTPLEQHIFENVGTDRPGNDTRKLLGIICEMRAAQKGDSTSSPAHPERELLQCIVHAVSALPGRCSVLHPSLAELIVEADKLLNPSPTTKLGEMCNAFREMLIAKGYAEPK